MLELAVGRFRRLAQNELLRHGALVFVSQNAVNVLSFVLHVLVSRRLGVAGYGSLNALLAGLIVLSVPASILSTIVAKYAAEFQALDDVPRLRALVVGILTSVGGSAIVIMLLGLALSFGIADYLHVGLTAVWLSIPILGFGLALGVLRGVLQGTENFRAFAVSAILESVVKVISAIVFIGFGWGLNGALGGFLLGSFAGIVFTAAVLWSRYRWMEVMAVRLDYVRLLRTSSGVAVATLCLASLGFSDVVIAKHVFDARTAGLYGATSLAGRMLFYLVGFVPAMCCRAPPTLPPRVRRRRPCCCRHLAMIALLAGAGLLVYATVPVAVIGTLMGGAFVGAAPLLLPYGIATTLLAAATTIAVFNIAIHRFGFVVPLAIVAPLELAAMATFHDSPLEVIRILIISDALALIAVSLGVRTRERWKDSAALDAATALSTSSGFAK